MEIRKFNFETDYSTVSYWWKKQKWPAIPQEMLPKTGFIVEDLCAGWLYKTDSKIAILEFIISNPDANFEERGKALDLLIVRLSEAAKQSGYSMIFTSASNKRLITRYRKHEFQVTDKEMTNMIARIS